MTEPARAQEPMFYMLRPEDVTLDEIGLLQAEMEADGGSLQEVARNVVAGAAQVWKLQEEETWLLALTEVLQSTDGNRVMWINALVGGGKVVVKFKNLVEDTLVSFARENHATKILCRTNLDLARYLAQHHAFTPLGIVMGKEIGDGQ